MTKEDIRIEKADAKTWLTSSGSVRNPYHSTVMAVEDVSLECTDGPHKGMVLRLDRDRCHIGRADWCDICLIEDMRISRHHCEIRLTDQGLVIKDLGSSNGTFVGPVRVFEALLNFDVPFQVGSSQFALRAHHQQREIKVNFHDDSCRLVGRSEPMRQIFSMLSRLSPWEAPVLLLGETGTGKSSVAQALHDQSHRSNGDFVAVNCGALSPSLIESQFFGNEKGAFTGAQERVRGFFEQAHGGTLFLDEIGELPLDLQPKLLDVLERKKIRRLGGEHEIDVDFRLVAATHQNLEQAVANKTFREDLFYRINVVPMTVPPLRERLEDIPLLAEYMLTTLSPKQEIQLSNEASEKMKTHLWPGNVRELYNVLRRALVFQQGNVLYADDIKLRQVTELKSEALQAIRPNGAGGEQRAASLEEGLSLKDMLDREEKRILEAAVIKYDWNIPQASKAMGVSRASFYDRLSKHGIKRKG